MKYPYIVGKNGVWYPAGTEVPVGGKPVEDKKTEKQKKDDFSQYMNHRKSKKKVRKRNTQRQKSIVCQLLN